MPAPRPRKQLLKAVDETLRKVGAQSVLISDLVATRVGLNSTDLECLDLLYLAGVTTAGTLARHTGLSTGATTAVIDRLERAGFVRRRRDTHDRRCVLVEVLPESADRIMPLYAPLTGLVEQLNKQFRDDQLEVVVEYLSRALDVGAEYLQWLQAQPAPARRAATRRANEPAPAAAEGTSTRTATERG